MYETEYMPDVQSIEYNEDGTGIKGGNFYTGMSEDGVKQYQFVPFDAENPTEIYNILRMVSKMKMIVLH